MSGESKHRTDDCTGSFALYRSRSNTQLEVLERIKKHVRHDEQSEMSLGIKKHMKLQTNLDLNGCDLIYFS